jgi:hypothetical protein
MEKPQGETPKEKLGRLMKQYKMTSSEVVKKNLKKIIDKLKKDMKDVEKDVEDAVEDKPKAKPKRRATKKPTATKKKPSKADYDKAKKDLNNKAGKTYEECKEIIKEYEAKRKKSQAGKEKAKKRTTTLKNQGKLTPQGKKKPEVVIEEAGEKVVERVEESIKEIKKTATPKPTKGSKPTKAETTKVADKPKVKAKVKEVVKEQMDEIADMVKQIVAVVNKTMNDKALAKQQLIKLRDKLTAEINKMEYGGLTDGATQNMNVTQSQMSEGSVNPQAYAKGGGVDAKVYELKSYYVDVFKDSYTEGETDMVNNWDSRIMQDTNLTFDSKEELFKRIIDVVKRDADAEYSEKDFEIMQEYGATRIQTSVLCKYIDLDRGYEHYEKASKSDIENWKNGNMTLYSVRFDFNVEVYKPRVRAEFRRGGKIDKNSLVYDVFPKIHDGNGIEGTIRKMPENYYVASIDKEGNISFEDLEISTRNIDKDEVKRLYETNQIRKEFAHGGMTQGYNDRMDESLGMRHRGHHSQSHKDRRDEAKGMNKGMGNRAYQSVGTMDNMFEDGGRTLDVPNLNDGDFVPTYKKGGKADWIQKVVDSPKFDKGAFTRKAKNRGMTTTELMNDVLSNPNEYTLKTRRQAQFMKNVSR